MKKDDVGAIVSRMDAQTIVMIELLAELSGMDTEYFVDKYSKRYDDLAAKLRANIISEE